VTSAPETDVNGVIAYASCAFAPYYMLQCIVALLAARRMCALRGRSLHLAIFSVLDLVCLLVFALGLPSANANRRGVSCIRDHPTRPRHDLFPVSRTRTG